MMVLIHLGDKYSLQGKYQVPGNALEGRIIALSLVTSCPSCGQGLGGDTECQQATCQNHMSREGHLYTGSEFQDKGKFLRLAFRVQNK